MLWFPFYVSKLCATAKWSQNVTEQAVRTESEIARNELRMRYENAAVGAAWDELGNALFPEGHPYARSTIGSHRNIEQHQPRKSTRFVEDNAGQNIQQIVVVGDFSLEDSGSILLDAFNGAEELLMSPEDAAKFFDLIEDTNEPIQFFK